MMRILIAALVLAPLVALAQAWPAKPIRLIAPYPPGGQTDLVSRWLGEKLAPVRKARSACRRRRRRRRTAIPSSTRTFRISRSRRISQAACLTTRRGTSRL